MQIGLLITTLFFLTVLIVVLWYATTVVPPVRTIGTSKKTQPQVQVPSASDPLKYKMLEGDYASQFKLLLGYTILLSDSSPEILIEEEPVARYNRKVRQFDASGNPL